MQQSTQDEAQSSLFQQEEMGRSEPEIIPPAKAHRGANNLNDLSPREWLLATKSIWYRRPGDLRQPELDELAQVVRNAVGDDRAAELLGQPINSVMLSTPPTRDSLKVQHPATFAETDIERLIRFFSKHGETVLDPFLGSGSTLLAARAAGRRGVGIELIHRWAEIAKRRLDDQPSLFGEADLQQTIIEGDALETLTGLETGSVDFVITSPPYWSVLNKPADHKVRDERLDRGLETRYSEEQADLANIERYDDFLDVLLDVFTECARVVREGHYVAVVVSDFRDKSKFYLFHADIAQLLESAGMAISGITILVQDSKTLYPYGMPYAFVSNIHHQYVVIARNMADNPGTRRARGDRRPF